MSCNPRAPCLFLSHGTGPFPLLDPDQESYRQLVRQHASKLDGVKGILLFSAHWETGQPHITASDNPGIYYDYEDMRNTLPPAAFSFEYPVAGNAKLAIEIANQLRDHGFDPVLDNDRGLDHAVYVPMTLLRPSADIPIVQMSIIKGRDEDDCTQKNIKLGQAVARFRDAGFAIIGSGGSYHDFNAIAKAFFTNEPVTGAEQFEEFLRSVASIPNSADREEALLGWRADPTSRSAHPRGASEHLMPYMVASGAGGDTPGIRFARYEYKGAPMSFYMW
ncbi:DODA-type extradiol aromatic ring-opening family dioxygenase [Aspergillus puulaauensis]|uniref:Extradiol ring-cleavage dioxygenase class III enzyme subunit B domain-containing protein n=1 Tax=Aspergillus puulaauensis TaxID=1220207 RepID=A0A7R8AIA4_9EURO|nr:uncharacterized protein APUU_20303A [Aspergillus puulaauensis]BCS19871.1 hypothetical protein APUU_20303A [Aspergillus puulaauensis]